MMEAPDNREHRVKRIVLPSGKTVEVVYFSDPAGTAAQPAAPLSDTQAPSRGLHVCPDCASDLVHPTDWSESTPGAWNVALRCPNCEWTGEGNFSQELVDMFDDELDAGTDALVRDLKRLTRANMEEEIDRFAAALDAGAILPEDFGQPAAPQA